MLTYTDGDLAEAMKAMERPRHETLLRFYLVVCYDKLQQALNV